MSKPFDDCTLVDVHLDGKSVEELLYLVGDVDHGCKQKAMDTVLSMGLRANYETLEIALRNDADADLRNSAMEVFVSFGKQAVPKLLMLLRDENEEVRNFSAVMLGDIASREAVGPLINALRDPDANVSHAAAEALGKIGDRTALLPLLELCSGDFWLQYPAVVAMGEMRDSRAVPCLLQLLDDEMLKEPVIEALGKIGDPRALYYLAEILCNPAAQFAAQAARAIVAIQNALADDSIKNSLLECNQEMSLTTIINRQGIENLRNLLHQTGARETIIAAVALLGRLDEAAVLPEFFPLLELDDYQETVEDAILALGRAAIPFLIPAVSHPTDNVKIAAIRSLRRLGGINDVMVLLPILAESGERVRFEALEMLKGMHDDELLPHLVRLVENGSPVIKNQTLEVISRYPSRKVDVILASLEAAADPDMRKAAATLIGLAQDVSAVPLLSLLADTSPDVRREAAKAAGNRGFRGAVPLLIAALSDADAGVRAEAVKALAEFADEAFLGDILRLLGSDTQNLDYIVIRAVGRIGSGKAVATLLGYLKKDGNPRHLEFAIIDTLGKLDNKAGAAVQAITDYLAHSDPDIRRLAVEALAGIAGVDAISNMVSACNDPHWSVRLAAIHALGRIGDDRGVPAIVAALADDDFMVRENAFLVLGDLRAIRTVPDLVKQLTDSEVGKFAFEAVLKFGRNGLPWLHRVMKGNYPQELRERVIDLIGKIGDQKSVEPLLEILEDANPVIRLAAIDALVFCYNSAPLKKLIHIKRFDADDDVKCKADLALKALTLAKFS
jgi:HEAT repeat protein